MIKLKSKMLRGVSFTIETNGKEINVDSLFPRGFKTKLIERFLEEFSVQVKTEDPEMFVKALFYFVYGDDIPKHARERESDIIEFLKWRVGVSVKEVPKKESAVSDDVPEQAVQKSEVLETKIKKEPEQVKKEDKETPKHAKKGLVLLMFFLMLTKEMMSENYKRLVSGVSTQVCKNFKP